MALTERHKAEREYYLGKLDEKDHLPGTKTSLKDARKAYQESEAKAKKKREEFRKNDKRKKFQSEVNPDDEKTTTIIGNQIITVDADEPEVKEKEVKPSSSSKTPSNTTAKVDDTKKTT